MRLTKKNLIELGARSSDAEKYLSDLNRQLQAHDINTPLRASHFLSQVYHESSNLRRVVENLNYTSAERILQIFGGRIAAHEAASFVRQPQRLASRVYANRIGNGNEASGDGWRYRGRGLIQLTGKANYRAFKQWSNEDVVASPDRVQSELAVLSAVFFWVTNDINRLADADDVRAVTKAVNGGVNGLSHRIQLLDKAKSFLKFKLPATGAFTHRVKSDALNLRSEPRVQQSTWLATMPNGTPVEKIGPGGAAGWVRIRTSLAGTMLEGVASSEHLEPIPSAETGLSASMRSASNLDPPEVHLSKNRRDVTRVRDGGRAHPLGEIGRPRRSANAPAGRVGQIGDIINWLDSESPTHLRYKPKSGTTFCNIYAYDYCCLAQVYLPRVWWKGSALESIARGEEVPIQFGRTVEELNANRLHDWLFEYGPGYGWQHVTNLDVLQAAANAGDACLITGKRADLNRPGHITAVVPETDAMSAARSANGSVKRPVESQAGSTNTRARVSRSAWWLRSQFSAFGLWRHA